MDNLLKPVSVLKQPNRKRWGARLDDAVKHLSHKVFSSENTILGIH